MSLRGLRLFERTSCTSVISLKMPNKGAGDALSDLNLHC